MSVLAAEIAAARRADRARVSLHPASSRTNPTSLLLEVAWEHGDAVTSTTVAGQYTADGIRLDTPTRMRRALAPLVNGPATLGILDRHPGAYGTHLRAIHALPGRDQRELGLTLLTADPTIHVTTMVAAVAAATDLPTR